MPETTEQRMTEERLQAMVDGEFEQALGGPDGSISARRAKAWDYYLGKPFGDEDEDRSKIVTHDVADVVDGIMPSLMRLFATADNLLDFDPVGKEDEDQAEQESDYVNYLFFKQNPAFLILFYWFFDALTQINGVVKCYWDDSRKVTTETYTNLTEEGLDELLADDELEPVERSERTEEREAVKVTELGPAKVTVKVKLHDVTFKRTRKRGRVKIVNVPGDEYRISSDSRSVDPSEARLVGHEREVTRSELIEMGFDKKIVAELPALASQVDTQEKRARRPDPEENRDGPHDKSQDRILLREAYYKVDWDGDGIAELRQVFTAGGRLMKGKTGGQEGERKRRTIGNEPADRQPFHVICPQPLPHKHYGLSMADKVMDIQEINSTLVRQVHDNLYHANNPGHAVWEQGIGDNTLDDLLTTAIGSVKRFARPPSESWQQISIPFTAGSTFPMMEYWDKSKRDRSGISSDGEGLSPEALKHVREGVLADSVDIGKMKVEQVARVAAETGLKSLFLHMHELVLKHQQQDQVVKLRNKWVQVSPKAWRERFDMTVNIGLGIGSREQTLIRLEAIWSKLQVLAQSERYGPMVTPQNVYDLMGEVIKSAGFKNPDRFVTLAAGGQGNQAQQAAMAAQLDLARQQLAIEQQKNQLQASKHQLEREKTLAELRLKAKDIDGRQMIAFEELANQLTELELKYGRNVPGAKV